MGGRICEKSSLSFCYQFIFRDAEPASDGDGRDGPRDNQGDGSLTRKNEGNIFLFTPLGI